MNLALFQALCHASVFMERKLVVDWVPSCDLEDSAAKEVSLLLTSC
jgi:CTP synthase